MNDHFKQRVLIATEDRPRLTPLFGSTHCIPERLYEYNSNLFLCFNNATDQFEVHSLDNKGNTYCATLPFPTLDSRTIHWVWENDIRVHGMAIFQRIDRSEAEHKARKQREFKNWVESVALETRSMFAKDAWLAGT